MPNLKITQLVAGTPKATDLYPAVDTTDSSMSPSGTDKKYLLSDIKNFIANSNSGTHGEVWIGPFFSSTTSNIYYQLNGDIVSLSIAGFDRTSGGAATTIRSVTGLPTIYRPLADRFFNCYVDQLGNSINGTLCIRTTGLIEFGVGIPTNSGTLSTFPNLGSSTNGVPLGMECSYSVSNI